MTSVAGDPTGQVMAAPLMLRVNRPASRTQEKLADDVCTDTVGRVMSLGGTRVLDGANAVLDEVANQIPDHAVARHAAACLAVAATVPGKVMQADGDAQEGPRLKKAQTDTESGRRWTEQAYGDLTDAAKTFGHIRLTRNIESIARALDRQDQGEPAARLLGDLAQTLEDRKVKPDVVAQVQDLRQQIAGGNQ
ncbi:hypothetical protein [Kitasatospora sp. NPDC085879]|uniref:hypothetical protein n=1 Tax=Kitasatospora sp. NPDC085879 TaxID=3154769 RepID=UPI0034287FC7